MEGRNSKKLKKDIRLLKVLIVILVTVCVLVLGVYFLNFGFHETVIDGKKNIDIAGLADRADGFSAFGSYVGGVLGPLLSSLTLIALFVFNRLEMGLLRENNSIQYVESRKSVLYKNIEDIKTRTDCILDIPVKKNQCYDILVKAGYFKSSLFRDQLENGGEVNEWPLSALINVLAKVSEEQGLPLSEYKSIGNDVFEQKIFISHAHYIENICGNLKYLFLLCNQVHENYGEEYLIIMYHLYRYSIFLDYFVKLGLLDEGIKGYYGGLEKLAGEFTPKLTLDKKNFYSVEHDH